MRSFLSKVDNWLAARYPILWATQAHKILIYTSIYIFLGAFALFFTQWSIPYVFNIHDWWKFLYIPVVLLGIYWIWAVQKYKVEDRFGLVGKRQEWARLLAVTSAIASLVLAPMLIRDAGYARLRMMIPREEFVRDLLVIKENFSEFDISDECKIEEFENAHSAISTPDSIAKIEFKKIRSKYTGKSSNAYYSMGDYQEFIAPFAYSHGAGARLFPPINFSLISVTFALIFLLLNVFLPLLYADFRAVIYMILGYFSLGVAIFFIGGQIINPNKAYGDWLLVFLILLLYFGMFLLGGKNKVVRSPQLIAAPLLISSTFTPIILALFANFIHENYYESYISGADQLPLGLMFVLNALVWIYWTAPRLRRLYAYPNVS